MNWSQILALLPVIIQGIDVAHQIQGDLKNNSVLDTVKADLPAVFNIFMQVGQTLFPGLPTSQQPAAGSTAFATSTVKTVQNQLNELGQTPPLAVDGVYGSLTKAAVAHFQTANGLQADGWAGPLTQAALNSKMQAGQAPFHGASPTPPGAQS